MALSASTVWEVRFDGSDNNGGGFVSGGSGTDRSQQAAAHATLTTASTVHTTTTQINVAVGDYTVTSLDVDNILQITGGTATAGFYRITAADVPNNRWTVDRSAGTAGQTVAGAMGGALASPGKAMGAKVASNTIWWKLSASTYDITTTTANVSGGRVDANAANLRVEGYETTRGDLSTNRPTLKATVNTMTMFTESSGAGVFGNFILNTGSATAITPITTGAATTTHRVKAINGKTTASFNCSSGSFLLLCGATGGTVPGFRMNGATLAGCVATGMSTFGFESASSVNTCVGCIADEITAGNPGFTNTGATARLWAINCTSYGHAGGGGSHGFSNAVTAYSMSQVNCIADTNAGTGVGASNATTAFNCIGRNNATAFGPNCVQFGSVTLTGDPFTSSGANDFSLNNNAGAGADARGTGLPGAFPDVTSTTGYIDIGAAQHQDTVAEVEAVTNSRHVLLTLPRTWIIEN